MKIAYSDQEGYSGKVVSDQSVVKCKSYREVFESVVTGQADKGIVPVENSLHGTDYDVYDLCYEYEDVWVVGELEQEIIPNKHYVRYFIISKEKIPFEKADKSSMIFIVSHKPGSLYHALSIFENYELNLTKIESRKVFGKPYEYIFYVDFEYSKEHRDKIDEIIAIYKENTQDLRILGFYKSGSNTL